MKLSNTTLNVLMALASDERLVVATLYGGWANKDDDWHAAVCPHMGNARFTVPINTFRKMRRDGLLTKEREWLVSDNGLTHCEYVLTEAGHSALKEQEQDDATI